jgi:hypothetical protein
MSDSIRESILLNLKTTLEGITTVAGYNYTILSVQRWQSRGNNYASVPCIVINSGAEDKEPGPDPQTTCKFIVFIEATHRQDDDSTENSDTIISKLLADIEKAVMADYTRGGYAEDTKILGNVPFETVEGQPAFGIIVNVEIHYRHKNTDPALYV